VPADVGLEVDSVAEFPADAVVRERVGRFNAAMKGVEEAVSNGIPKKG
jgi:hypothetical protein